MLSYSFLNSIRDELLIKAKRDTSKLVLVQRMVTRNGKTFPQNFYVLPSQVKSTDRVIGNHQNLLPKIGSVPKPAPGVFDKAYFDTLVSDKQKAMDYLKSVGVVWSDTRKDGTKVVEHLSWMRALMALKQFLKGQNTTSNPTQGNTQAVTQPQQPAQATQTGNNSSSNASTALDTTKLSLAIAGLNQAIQDDLKACKNGKEQVLAIKKHMGKDGFMQFAKLSGADWNEHSHVGINVMRASEAVRDLFDALYGTVSPGKKGKAGAPKGNQNAKKDSTQQPAPTPPPAPKIDSKLEIPKNATQREINLINLINGIDNVDDLKAYTGIGMVPEDDVAKGFMFDKLIPKYEAFVKNIKGDATARLVKDKHKFVEDLKISGCKKDLIEYQGLNYWYDKFNMGKISNPRDFLFTPCSQYSMFPNVRTKADPTSIGDLISNIYTAYSKYTTDDYNNYKTNLGYEGWDSDIYTKQYDHNKDGFVCYLNKLASDNPSVKPKVDTMISKYDELMEKVGHNPNLLKLILTHNEVWNTGEDKNDKAGWMENRLSSYSIIDPLTAKKQLEYYNYQADAIPKAMKALGLSDEEIQYTLEYYWNDDLRDIRVHDASGPVADVNRPGRAKSIDLTKVINPDTGKPFFGSSDSRQLSLISSPEESRYCNRTIMNYVRSKQFGLPLQKDVEELINKLNTCSKITKEDFAEIHKLSMDLFGVKLTYKKAGNNKHDIINFSYKTYEESAVDGESYTLEKNGEDSQLDYIMSNMQLAYASISANRLIAGNVDQNTRSKINDSGKDYSKNFSFYHADSRLGAYHYIRRTSPGSAKEYTVSELNNVIDYQLNNVISLSPSELDKIKSYYGQETAGKDEKEKFKFLYDQKLTDINADNPTRDILFKAGSDMLKFIPKMKDSATDKKLSKKLGYTPYSFSTTQSTTSTQASATSEAKLKKARQDLLKAVNCSVKTEDEATSLQMRKEFYKNWDYDGKTHAKLYSGSGSFRGADRRALFNSRFFKINNSNFEEPFKEYAAKYGQTPEEHYHATSYAGVAGIIGHDGAWKVGDAVAAVSKTAQALGNGAYFGKKGGKSSVYCGEGKGGYHDLSASGAQGDNANGCYILAGLIHGSGNKDRKDYNGFREYETVVFNNKCILPHHFVDISCRSLNVNVRRDAQGNYLDWETGAITHDKYGTKIDMK